MINEKFDPEIFSPLPFFSRSTISVNKRLHLHGIVVSAGHEHISSKEYLFNGLKRGNRPFAVFQLTIKGKGILQYDDKRVVLEPGSLMLTHVPHKHAYYCDGTPWEFVYICVSGSEFLRLHEDIETIEGPVLLCDNYPRLDQLILRLLLEIQGTQNRDEFELSGSIYRVYMKIISTRYQTSNLKNISRRDQHVILAENWCRSHYTEQFSIEQLADRLGIDRSYLSREFSRTHGITLRAFIENIRLEKSMDLLCLPDPSIQEVALDVGFLDVNYFCRVFRKRIGMSPGEYRMSRFML